MPIKPLSSVHKHLDYFEVIQTAAFPTGCMHRCEITYPKTFDMRISRQNDTGSSIKLWTFMSLTGKHCLLFCVLFRTARLPTFHALCSLGLLWCSGVCLQLQTTQLMTHATEGLCLTGIWHWCVCVGALAARWSSHRKSIQGSPGIFSLSGWTLPGRSTLWSSLTCSKHVEESLVAEGFRKSGRRWGWHVTAKYDVGGIECLTQERESIILTWKSWT